ncbi:MAG: UDP-N-acetylmuramate--L-alanine ligase, partial [Verrucomicrobiia bacterium]
MKNDWSDFFVTSRKRHRIHLLGVAGSGMSGLAGLLLDLGHDVSGSDRVTSLETERLQRCGLRFYTDQKPEQLEGSELVVYSSAVQPGHTCVKAAVELGIPLLRRAEALAAILATKKGIVVAGTHGKTTTSAMIAHLLRLGGLHPSHYVGAEIPVLGTNALWDAAGEWFVAEGDESDGTLRLYETTLSVILNIETDHLDYYKDLAAIEEVFAELIGRTSGAVITCSDDPVALRVAESHAHRSVSYGEVSSANVRFANIRFHDLTSTFEVIAHGQHLGQARLGVPGRHNVSNATAAVAVALELGLGFDCIREGLGTFEGARRRIEVRYRSPQYIVVDDYGHHPTEIKATLSAVKECGRKRISVIFQPHRYSRTAALRKDFATAFENATRLWLAPVYAAGEEPIEGADSLSLATAIQRSGHPSVQSCRSSQAARLLAGHDLLPGDLLLTLGAGNIHLEAAALARDLHRLEQ